MTDFLADAGMQRLRNGILGAVRQAIDVNRQSAAKWDPLYQWFADEMGVGDGQKNGPIIGKLITESKQIGNRCDEMARYNPHYAVISLLGDVTSDQMLLAMRRRGRLSTLRCVLFLRETTPDRLVIFDG